MNDTNDRRPWGSLQLFVLAGPDTTYTVQFINEGAPDKASAQSLPFSSLGGSDHTWVRTKMTGKEYLLRATVRDAFALKAYVRQLPGPDQPSAGVPQLIVVEAWRSGAASE
jgi:hypothetical protein